MSYTLPGLIQRVKDYDDSYKKLIVQDKDSALALKKRILGTNSLYFDTETSSVEFDRFMVGFSVTGVELDGSPWGFYVPVKHSARLPIYAADNTGGEPIGWKSDPFKNIPHATAMHLLNLIFRKGTTVWMHNAKFDLKTVRDYGVDIDNWEGEAPDTMLLAWLAEVPMGERGLKRLVRDRFDYNMREFSGFDEYEHAGKVPVQYMAPYAVDDTLWLAPLSMDLLQSMAGSSRVKAFFDLEVPICRIIEKMESRGAALDTEYLYKLKGIFQGRVDVLHQQMADCLGLSKEEVRYNSGYWLSDFMIDEAKHWPVRASWERGKSGKYSSKKDIVEEWAAGMVPKTTPRGKRFADLLLEMRGLKKLTSTYTNTLADKAVNGRLHGRFNQMGTATGRFSSSGPNMQNIPIRSEDGLLIRQAFIASAGMKLVGVDYSQIELRVLGHLSNDPVIIEAYNSDKDFHQITADKIGSSRADGKTVNFAIIFGMMKKSLAKKLKVSEKQAGMFIDRYFAGFPAVKKYMRQVVNSTKRSGYVTTMTGRKRALPDINSRDWGFKSSAERKAFNTKVQGTAADILKIAMRNIDRAIRADPELRGKCHIIIQVHDELIGECEEHLVDKFIALMKYEMENAVKLRVKLKAEPVSGDTWRDVK